MDRKYLRKKIQEVLKAANIEGIGEDVLSMRSIPSNIEELPLALIYTKNETINRFDESPKRYMRNLDVMIEIFVTDNDDECLADSMDDLSRAVEKAIENDREVESCVESIELQSVIYDTAGDGQSPLGSAVLTYQVEYITEPKDKYSHSDFNHADVTWNANGHTDNDTKDSIELNP